MTTDMHFMVSVSGGAGSTIAAHRTVEKYGADRVTLVFADTNEEHPSLYESLHHMINVALRHVEFVWINDGRNIWDVFNEFGYMKQPGHGCKASLELKRKPLDNYMTSRWKQGEVTKVIGYDHTEQDRADRLNKYMAQSGYALWYPLMEKPFLSPCQQIDLVRQWGYPDQVMYDKGFPHNNCGGGCVLAGISQWVGLYQDFPEKFNYSKVKEAEFMQKVDFSILRDRRGGMTKNLTLGQLEERIQANDLSGLQEFKSTCGCMTPLDGEE